MQPAEFMGPNTPLRSISILLSDVLFIPGIERGISELNHPANMRDLQRMTPHTAS